MMYDQANLQFYHQYVNKKVGRIRWQKSAAAEIFASSSLDENELAIWRVTTCDGDGDTEEENDFKLIKLANVDINSGITELR
jgi:hypothetical protein